MVSKIKLCLSSTDALEYWVSLGASDVNKGDLLPTINSSLPSCLVLPV